MIISHSRHTRGNYLPGLKGDALELIARFATSGITAKSFGLLLRAGANFSCATGYNLADATIAPIGWKANIIAQPMGEISLHVFLDRSIVETYSGGAVATTRCLLPRGIAGTLSMGVDLWAEGGSAKLITL